MDPREMLERVKQRPKNPIIQTPTRQHGFKREIRFVTGPPGKEHWKPDEMAMECSLCGQQFGLFIRRHHCRKCGEIYCHSCCKNMARLDQDSQFHANGLLVRVCDPCHKDSLNIPQEEVIETLSVQVPLQKDSSEIAETPLMSVPNDWSWSTF